MDCYFKTNKLNYATALCGAQWEHDILGAAFLGFSQVGASYRIHVTQLGSFLIEAFILKLLHVYAGLTDTMWTLHTLFDWKFSQLEQLFPILIDIIYKFNYSKLDLISVRTNINRL